MAANDLLLPESDFENPNLKAQGYSSLVPSSAEVFGAGMGLGTLTAPVNYLQDLNTYRQGEAAQNKLTVEQANKDFGIPGFLNFDRDISPDAARVIQERTMKRIEFEDVLNRSDGATGSTLGFAGEFVGQMFDPINLGLSFIPVTKVPGVSKLLMGLATKSPFVKRAAVGAIEGTVGQAAVEPIYAYGDAIGFEDHSNEDIMRNLAFGAVFGAGAQVTFGGVYDGAKFLIGKTQGTHKKAVTTAINQYIEGKEVNVEPIIRADKNFAETEAVRTQIENIEKSGAYDGPQGYGNVTGPETDLGLGNIRTFGKNDPVIVSSIAKKTDTIDVLDIQEDLLSVDLGGSNKASIANTAQGPLYIKLAPLYDQGRAKSELLANNIYQALGDDSVIPAQMVSKDGQLGVATPFYDGAVKVGAKTLLDTYNDPLTLPSEKAQIRGLLVNSVLDAFLGNRDSFAFGNIIKFNGQYKKIDQGGSLFYRAQGAKKEDFGGSVDELDTLMNSDINPESATILQGGLTKGLLREGVEKVIRLDLDEIIDEVKAMGFPKFEEEEILATLIARQNDLRNKFPEIAKAVGEAKGRTTLADPKSAFKELEKQAVAFNEKINEFPADKQKAFRYVMKDYQGTYNDQVNSFLRTGDYKYGNAEKIDSSIKLLLELSQLNPLTKETILSRWMPADLFNPTGDAGFMSTSLFGEKSPHHVRVEPKNNLLVVIHTTDKTPGFFPDGNNLLANADGSPSVKSPFSGEGSGEYEFVIKAGQKYEVLGPGVDKTTVDPLTKKLVNYKEINVRLLPEKPAKAAGPITLQELKASATEYFDRPSDAADIEVLLPLEAVTFNSVVKNLGPAEKQVSELEKMVADLELEVSKVLSKEELSAINQTYKELEATTDQYSKGLDQAFTCWKNG